MSKQKKAAMPRSEAVLQSDPELKGLAATGIFVWSPYRPGEKQLCLILAPESFTDIDEETGKPVAQVLLESFSEHFRKERDK